MKRIIFAIFACGLIFFSCNDQYDNIRQYAGEIIYPSSFDTIVGHIGFERVELDLLKTGRDVPPHIGGGAAFTIVEYDGEVQMRIPEIVSWVNVTGLKDSKLYRFKVYTEDIYGNKSVPQEIALIPYTQLDKDLFGVTPPRFLIGPESFITEWPAGIASASMDFNELTFEYTRADGEVITETITEPRFVSSGFIQEQIVELKITYNIVPVVDDTDRSNPVMLLDPIDVERIYNINILGPTSRFAPIEERILRANGLTEFTINEANNTKVLGFPLAVGSLSDLFFFPDLEVLDLTTAYYDPINGLDDVLPTATLSGNGRTEIVGGGRWYPYMRRVENTDWFDVRPPVQGLQDLIALLDRGIVQVKYIRNSMGLDDILEQYPNQVEFLEEDWFPDRVPLDDQFLHSGVVVTGAFHVLINSNRHPNRANPDPVLPSVIETLGNIEVVEDRSTIIMMAPWTENWTDAGLANNDWGRNATFGFTLPAAYMYDLDRYRYLKFKVLLVTDNPALLEVGNSGITNFRRMWPRIRYSFWGPDQGNNPWGSGDTWEWRPDRDLPAYYAEGTGSLTIPVNHVKGGGQSGMWFQVVLDLRPAIEKVASQEHGETIGGIQSLPRRGHHHFRCIGFNMGMERTPDRISPRDQPLYFYFADYHLSKTP